jgi:antitoxin (DNA-binding transcriptional repressor) of toxin-antitoxin stability system
MDAGEVTILTDYGKPIATIAPIEQTTEIGSGSDAGEFREALLSLPYHLDLGF